MAYLHSDTKNIDIFKKRSYNASTEIPTFHTL